MTEVATRDAGIPAQVNRARAALQTVETVEDAILLADYAEAVRYAAKQAKAGMEIENAAAEIRLRAERRAGEMLAAMEKHPPGPAPRDRSHDATEPPTLADLGVTKHQSSRYQQVAAVPEPVFEQHIEHAKTNGAEITTARLLRDSRKAQTTHTETVKDTLLSATSEETQLRLADDQVILLLYKALEQLGPVKAAEKRILQAISRADRDTLEYLDFCAGAGDAINRITAAARDLLTDNRIRRVK